MCVQETKAPDGATLPADQPYSYDGPRGEGGYEAGFLVSDTFSQHSTTGPVVAGSRIRWRLIHHRAGQTPTALCSFYAPHVGMDISTRRDFWVALTASVQAVSVFFLMPT